MTENSKICNIIDFAEKDGWYWEGYFEQMYPAINIKIDEKNKYAIFNYGIGADFKDPVIQEARGIIIDYENKEVVCWPFRKFGKYYEDYADEIDWSTAKIQEKIDGSIIKLWYDFKNNRWVFSTNSMIYAEDAIINEKGLNFLEYIKSAINYTDIHFDSLYKNITYIFELTGRENQVVIKYDTTYLRHIGTRNNITGEEYDWNIGIPKPKEFGFNKSLESCLFNISIIDRNDSGIIENCNHEGYVVVDGNYNRIKIKSDVYTILHNLMTNGERSKKMLISYLYNNAINVESICKNFPYKAHWIKYYDYKLTEVKRNMNAFIDITRKIYKNSDNNRKIVAKAISKEEYSAIGFKALDNYKSLEELLISMKKPNQDFFDVLCKYIPSYDPKNYSYLFHRADLHMKYPEGMNLL